MSFSKTVSVVAALTSIFGASIAGFKLAQDSQVKSTEEVNTKYETHITELQQQISGLEKQLTNVNPPSAVTLPQPTIDTQVQPPKPATLPPPAPTPPAPTSSVQQNQTTQE